MVLLMSDEEQTSGPGKELVLAELKVPKRWISVQNDLVATLGEQFEAVRVSGDWKDAKELLGRAAYLLMYEIRGAKGLTATTTEAHDFLVHHYYWLVKQAGYKVYGKNIMLKQAEAVNQQLWDDMFDGRQKLAAKRFQQRVQEVNRMLPGVFAAIMTGDFDQIANYVQLVKLDMDNVGYKAPGRYEVYAGGGPDILTEADKQVAAAAMKEVADYEKKLEAEKEAQMAAEEEIIDGDFYDEVWGVVEEQPDIETLYEDEEE